MASTAKTVVETASRSGFRVTPYEVLGYLIPGGILLTSIFIFEHWARSLCSTNRLRLSFHTPVLTALQRFASKLDEPHWELSVLFLLSLLGFVYVLGHIVASASSFFIDRLLVWKGRGYPYVELLNLEPRLRHRVTAHDLDAEDKATRISVRKRVSGGFYRGSVVWMNVIQLLVYVYVLSSALKLRGLLSPIAVTILIVAIGVGFSTSMLLKELHARRWRDLGDRKLAGWLRALTSYFANWYPIPYDWITNRSVGFLGTRRSFDERFRERYKQCFKEEFDIEVEEAETNAFWFPYMYVREHSPTLSALVENWLLQYAFARNLSAAFHLAFLYSTVSLAMQPEAASRAIVSGDAELIFRSKVLLAFPLLFFAGAAIMLVRYYYLYRAYYSRFVFRSFVYLSHQRRSAAR